VIVRFADDNNQAPTQLLDLEQEAVSPSSPPAALVPDTAHRTAAGPALLLLRSDSDATGSITAEDEPTAVDSNGSAGGLGPQEQEQGQGTMGDGSEMAAVEHPPATPSRTSEPHQTTRFVQA